jgi:hypothetical protein
MENQNINKTKSNLGISLLTGCGTSLAAFVVPAMFFYALVLWLLPGESGFFIQMICGTSSGVILSLVVAIVGGVTVFRAKEPRPLATGLLSWAGISLLINISIAVLSSLAWQAIQNFTTTTTEVSNVSDIFMLVGLIIIIITNLLAMIVGWLVYRRAKSKITGISSTSEIN